LRNPTDKTADTPSQKHNR